MERVIRKVRSLRRRADNPRYWLSRHLWPLCDNDRRLIELADHHRGERCFIIGNGPGLNLLDLKPLASEVTFGTNAIYTNHARMGFYPTYYAVEDVLVAEDRASEINAYRHGLKFFPNYLKRWIRGDDHTIFINLVAPRWGAVPGFAEDAAVRVNFGGTVSYVCMQLAYYMGFSQVYLVGFDHHYVIPASAKIDGNTILSTEADPNHFSPDYFGKGKRWHDPKVERMEQAYMAARAAFERAGRQIRNASAGGKLEVFERVAYADLFEAAP